MMKPLLLISFLLGCMPLLRAQSPEDRASQFLGMLLREHYDSCHQTFDSTLASKVSAEMLSKIGTQFSQFLGEYQGSEAPKLERKEKYDVVLIRLKYEKSTVRLSLSYNAEGKVAGIYFLPGASENSYQLPAYARLGSFSEKKLLVKSGKYQLPAVLTLPNNIENPPVAILLAGSGPNDKDESIGPNKVLKDIALGLASQGVASLRYDKRTLVYGSELNLSKTGIEEEVIEDALSAIQLLQSQEETRSSAVFLVGHSLGGMCAPLVAKRSSKVKALVLLAANARPLEVLLPEQYEYIMGLDSLDDEERSQMARLSRQLRRLEHEDELKKSPADSLPLGLSAYYWQSIKRYDQVAVAGKLKQPILVLQGGRDYQVTLKDADIWRRELSSDPKNKIEVLDELNHLFMEGEGKSKPQEYQQPAHVQEVLIRKIADWIKQCK